MSLTLPRPPPAHGPHAQRSTTSRTWRGNWGGQGCARGNDPAHRVPDPGHYQISSWATRFMRSAAAVLRGFCAMGARVSGRWYSPTPGLASPVARETGCPATWDAEAEAALHLARGGADSLCLLPASARLWVPRPPCCPPAWPQRQQSPPVQETLGNLNT